MTEQKKYALVTGAGRGLGKAFAIELAKRKINVLLTSLPNENLELFCQNLSDEHQIEAHYMESDLTSEDEVHKVVDWVKNHKYAVDILINNAGIGGTVEFGEAKESVLNDMILLNIRATTILTHQLLPNLKQQAPAWILNVASMAALSPIGYKTVYSASKSYIANFSKALYQELKDDDVFVGAVYPGQMTTHFDGMRRIAKQGALGKMSVLAPEVVARKTMDRLFKKNKKIFIGRGNKFTRFVTKIIPDKIRIPIITRIIKRDLK